MRIECGHDLCALIRIECALQVQRRQALNASHKQGFIPGGGRGGIYIAATIVSVCLNTP